MLDNKFENSHVNQMLGALANAWARLQKTDAGNIRSLFRGMSGFIRRQL